MDALVAQLSDPLVVCLIERQSEEVRTFVDSRLKSGENVCLSEIGDLCTLLDVLQERKMSQVMCRVLFLCESPFKERNSLDRHRSADALRGYISKVGALLGQAKGVGTSAARALCAFVGHHPANSSEWNFCMNLVNESDVLNRIAQVELSTSVCKLVQALVRHRANTLSLTQLGVLERLAQRLLGADRQEVKLLLDIFWTALEQEPLAIASNRIELLYKFRIANPGYRLGCLEIVETLRILLERFLENGHSKDDMEIRNEILIISCLIASRKERASVYIESGMLGLVLVHATAAENGLPTVLGTAELDVEFRQLCWALLVRLSADEHAKELIMDSLFIPTLVFYIDSGAPGPTKKALHHSQLEKLQCEAVTTLASLDTSLDETQSQVLVAFLRTAKLPEAQQAALDLLLVAGNIRPTVTQEAILPHLIRIAQEANCEILQSTALLALAEVDISFDPGFLVALYASDSEQVAVAALGCIRRKAAARIDKFYVFLPELLNCLEHKSWQLQSATFGVLADLAPHAENLLASWQNPVTGKSLFQVALDLVIEQVGSDPISDVETPLSVQKRQPRLLQVLSLCPDKEKRIRDAFGDIRKRCWAFFRAVPPSKDQPLTREQRIALAFIERYEDFQTKESWDALMRNENPVYYDRAFIQGQREDSIRAAQEALKEQQDQLDAKLQDQLTLESEFFKNILLKRDQMVQASQVGKGASVMKKRLEQKLRQKSNNKEISA